MRKLATLATLFSWLSRRLDVMMVAALSALSGGRIHVNHSFVSNAIFTRSDVYPRWCVPESSNAAEKSDENGSDVGAH